MKRFDENDMLHQVLGFKVGKTYIDIGYGKATYSMNRGTFQTKDRIKHKHRLFYTEIINNQYYFTDGQVDLYLDISFNDYLSMKFHVDGDFNRLSLYLPSDLNETFYGCGEQFSAFNLKGKRVPIWVSEHHSVKKIISKYLREKLCGRNPDYVGNFKHQQTYYVQPTFISSRKYAVHVDTSSYALFHFKKNQTVLSFREIPKEVIIFKAENYFDLSSKLTSYLGRQPLLPSWTEDGAILAIQGGIDVIKKKIEHARSNGIEISGIWSQDWSGHIETSFGYQVFWNWEYDQKLYKGLPDFIDELKNQNIQFLGYINTFLKENTKQFIEAKEKGYLVLDKSLSPYLIKSTTFSAGIIDLTNQYAFNWYKEIIKKNMIGVGMSGWMADFGEYLPTDAVIHEGKPEDIHNLWPTLWAKCNYEAILESNKKDLFFFSRAAYTHTSLYTYSMWSGDQHVDYSKAYGFQSVIPSMLGMSVSGIGVSHSDIGGYTTILHMKRNVDLMKRWSELSVFTPLFRTHEGNKPSVNVQFDHPDVINHFANMSRLFKQLSPYLHDMKQIYINEGIPVIRPVFYHFDDPYFYISENSYMYGSELLVYPALKENTFKHLVYLPKGNWIHSFTKKTYQQGFHEIEIPYGMPSVFYQEISSYRNLFETI